MDDFRIEALRKAAESISEGDDISAREIIKNGYPFTPVKREARNYTIQEMIDQFFRDGFIDRYSGERLVNPGILRALSEEMPDEFPYQAHWKTDECHMAYWDFQPTVDHIVPISLGGDNKAENWASTSMVNNSSKSNFTLEQLGWTLKQPGDIKDWDGLSQLFVQIVDENELLLKIKKIKQWYLATKIALERLG